MRERIDIKVALEELFRIGAPILARAIVDELSAGRSDDWVDQASSPLTSRVHCRLIREGVIPGVQSGRRWLARRADVDAYLESQSKRKRSKKSDPAELAEELGLRVVGGGRR